MNDLTEQRKRLDVLDEKILDLLAERNLVVKEVIQRKLEHQLPIFVASRETQKSEAFRQMAIGRGLDPDWAEDFLRMIMSASRASQSAGRFPSATAKPKHILFVGGKGGMGSLYRHFTDQSGHVSYCLDKENWHELDEIAPKQDLVIVTVPIRLTTDVIRRVAPRLNPDVILADFTSYKAEPLKVMLDAHPGPVIGLHPMHGPEVPNLSKQLMVCCPERESEKAEWFLEQCRLWGMRVIEREPAQHDHVMNLVQGLRHFVALLHGSFMRKFDLKPDQILDYSSPIYRAELMMTGRIFAQSPELYADIVFSDESRRELLLSFYDHHELLARMVRENDRQGFIREFEAVTDFFGSFAAQALDESGYLINRLTDRFS